MVFLALSKFAEEKIYKKNLSSEDKILRIWRSWLNAF